MKKRITNIILIIIFFAGFSLLLYPTISDYWNGVHQSKAIASYTENVANLDDNVYERLWNEAEEYNRKLPNDMTRFHATKETRKEYEDVLNVSKNGIMSYIEIPEIACVLPIYHGIDDDVLQVAVGHIEGSSLPVGGIGTHCVLSGHRGLPSAKLFSDLDQLVEGDIFILHTLDETLTYEVDQIRIVLPNEVNEVEMIETQDLCTLVTCTPYGVNTHRLLIRGHRIENIEDSYDIHISTDALIINPEIVAPILAIPILLILTGWVMICYKKRK